jgi:plastocyanin
MATIAPTPTTHEPGAATSGEWVRLLAWTAGVVAVVDVGFIALVGEVIPPLAISAVLTLVGLALLRRLPRTGVVVLGLTSLLMLVGGVAFAAPHLAHPASGVDFFHAVVGIFGRIVAIGVAVAALRRAPAAGARRVGGASTALLALSLLVAAVATVAATGEQAQADDVVTVITNDFDETIEVAAGGTLCVDNQKAFRHTFTVVGTSIDVDVPASQGVRIPIELSPGTYEVVCELPGHEYMSSTLAVR